MMGKQTYIKLFQNAVLESPLDKMALCVVLCCVFGVVWCVIRCAVFHYSPVCTYPGNHVVAAQGRGQTQANVAHRR